MGSLCPFRVSDSCYDITDYRGYCIIFDYCDSSCHLKCDFAYNTDTRETLVMVEKFNGRVIKD